MDASQFHYPSRPDQLASHVASLHADALRYMNADLFADGSTVTPAIAPSRAQRAWTRAVDYCSTVWRALRGERPYDGWD